MPAFLLAARPAVGKTAKSAETGGLATRAPKLKEASDLFVASIVKALQTMAGPTTVIEGMLAGASMGNVRDVLAGVRADCVVGSIVMKDPPPPGMMLITLDGTLVHAIVELLCGGNGAEAQATEPRPVTPIDQQFAQIVFTLAASAVQTEWIGSGFASAKPAKIEGVLTADVFGPRVDEVGVVDVTIGIFGLHGTLRLVLPPAVLDRFAGEAATASSPAFVDTGWASHLHRELGLAPVALSAFLDAKDIPLNALAALKVGQVLHLPTDARSRASLVADGTVLYRGEVGRDDSHYSLRINELVSEPAGIARMAARRSSYFEASKV